MTDSATERTAVSLDDDFEVEFPGARRAATLCAANLVRCADRLLAEIDRRRRTVASLSANAFQILAVLDGAGEPLAPHVIADRLLVTSGTMTSLLDTVERHGLVRRVPHPRDRRKLLIDITHEGRGIVDRMLPRVHAAERDIFTGLSDDECQILVELLERLQARLDALGREPVPDGEERRMPRIG